MFTRVCILFSIAFMFCALPGYSLQDGWYKIINKYSGKALTVKGNSTSDGAYLVQYTYNGGTNQIWYVENIPDDTNNFLIVSAKSEKVADVKGASTMQRAYLEQWTYNGGNNQRFSIQAISGTSYHKIIAKHSGKAMDLMLQSTSDNNDVIQFSYDGRSTQQWQLVSVAAPGAAPSVGSSCATKYPILLLHGVALKDVTLSYNYFGRVPKNLTDNGAKVFGGGQDAWANTASNALQIRDRINQITQTTYVDRNGVTRTGYGYGKVNVIGHSKGGLDTRKMLYLYPEMKARVASLTTVASPHRGSYLANIVKEMPSWAQSVLSTAINIVGMVIQGDKNPNSLGAADDMQIDNAAATNARQNDLGGITGIYCQSYSAYIKTWSIDAMMQVGKWLIDNYMSKKGISDRRNDGAVHVTSAPFGTDKGTNVGLASWSNGLTHFGIVDRGILIFPGFTPGFDGPAFYRAIVSDLKAKGY